MLAAAATLTALMLPASAAAETFRGKTDQGKPVTIETRPDGEMRKATWRWETTTCAGDPGLRLRTQSTRLRTPRKSRPGFFTAKGVYRVRFSDSRIRFEVSSTGRQRTPERWTGSFRAKAFVKLDDGGRSVCRLRRLDWAAKL